LLIINLTYKAGQETIINVTITINKRHHSDPCITENQCSWYASQCIPWNPAGLVCASASPWVRPDMIQGCMGLRPARSSLARGTHSYILCLLSRGFCGGCQCSPPAASLCLCRSCGLSASDTLLYESWVHTTTTYGGSQGLKCRTIT